MTRIEEIIIAADEALPTTGRNMPTFEMLGFISGAKWADNNPKSPWISVKDNLPCNHEQLISLDDKRYTLYVVAVIHGISILSRMYKEDDKWYWENDEPTYWFPIPELPK